MRTLVSLISLLTLFAIVPGLAQADMANGKAVYAKACSSCHGVTGAGDGPVGANLPPAMKPRDLSKGEYKMVKDVTTLVELLTKGGSAFGMSPLMAAQPSLSEQDKKDVAEYALSLKAS